MVEGVGEICLYFCHCKLGPHLSASYQLFFCTHLVSISFSDLLKLEERFSGLLGVDTVDTVDTVGTMDTVETVDTVGLGAKQWRVGRQEGDKREDNDKKEKTDGTWELCESFSGFHFSPSWGRWTVKSSFLA